MDRIRKSLEIAEINLPDDIMRQLENLQVESAEISRVEKRVYNDSVNSKLLQQLQQTVDVHNFKELENDYVRSGSYRAYRQKEDELSRLSLALISPYLGEDEVKAPKNRQKSLEEQINYMRRIYGDVYGISQTDLEQLIGLYNESAVLNERFKALLHKSSSPELQQLRLEINELNQKSRQIRRSYEKKYPVKQQARRNIRRELAPRNVRRDWAKEKERKLSKQTARIERLHDIKLSDKDREAVTSLFHELETLKEDLSFDRRNGTDEITNFENRMESILQPYKERQNKD